ncbi:MAG: hypothetical protein Q7I97_09115 [Thermovirgaceae bacterium]|nr:hypothetical protein [Thermovirgaceae bacterium]
MLKLEVEHYILLGQKIRERATELCNLYMKVHFECTDCEVFVSSVETGKSGRFRIMFTESDMEDILNLPSEYLWLTDDEVAVRMTIDRDIREGELKERRRSRV